ncbi:DUF4349 domain-containing protein [Chitinivorax sp. B]|uniref:DUF4349 domain-containing protein n=1 Tax=Chitinivorax sp. B TaxID=2502235 RepID=UPI0010F5AE78|nr:DUF4349 domain-containing protein [Chitinivorax sp. B]
MRHLALSVLLSASVLTACGKKEAPMANMAAAPAAEVAAPAAPPVADQADYSRAAGAAGQAEAAPQRYLAIRHHLTIESDPVDLEKAWQAAQAKCLALGCEILSAGLQRNEADRLPSAELSLRIPPKNVTAFFETLKQGGHIQSQQTTTEDKTDAVVDVEARLKNYTELRDRLRQMITNKDGKLADVLAVHKELANTQAEIDHMTGMRKVLANETEKVAIDVQFVPIRSIAERGVWTPLGDAWQRSGYNFTSGLADVLHFVTSAIPWLLLIAPAVWLWRRRRKARSK